MLHSVWLSAFITVMLLFQIAAVPALILRKNDLADVLWGPAFPLTAFAAAYWGTGGLSALDTRALLILALVTIWAIRLFVHVGWRNLIKTEEDVRYANWRRQWGNTWIWRSYLQVFVLQPLILYILISPVLLAIATAPASPDVSPQPPLSPLAWVGLAIWALGFIFEAVGDEQLRRFKSDKKNKGQLMTTGLWSWTRHPNYFGEITLWWGIWLMVAELPYGWATVIGPLGVTYLILKVSGVTMLEELMQKRPGYAEYAAKTPRFFPRPPRA